MEKLFLLVAILPQERDDLQRVSVHRAVDGEAEVAARQADHAPDAGGRNPPHLRQ